MWLDVLTFLCNKFNLIVFFSHEKKISQILESLARIWNKLERNGLATMVTWLKQRESMTHNWLKQRESITDNSNFLVVPCSSSYPSFTVNHN